jgi:hypothetical protein
MPLRMGTDPTSAVAFRRASVRSAFAPLLDEKQTLSGPDLQVRGLARAFIQKTIGDFAIPEILGTAAALFEQRAVVACSPFLLWARGL